MADDKELEKKEALEEAKTEEVKEEVVEEEALEANEEKKQAIGGPKSKKKKVESTYSLEEANVEDNVEDKVEEDNVEEAPKSNKDLVEAKIRKQIEKKQQKEASLGVYRITEYLKEEHQWEILGYLKKLFLI